jgi:ubiquinol-cytochrome c reductase cytochrome b subunit
MNKKNRLIDYLDARLGVRDLLARNLTEYLLPRNINVWYTMGAVLLTLFVIQFATGILLLVYYDPNTEQAFHSVQRIMNEIPYGWLIRTLHAVGANVIIIVLLLHMLSVMIMASYKPPRELTWVTGFLILQVSFALGLTGYLLPWSQLSFWATTVATETPGAIPLIGDQLVVFLRGGIMVGQETLGRFFALHVMGLPLLVALLIAFHLFCVRRVGISRPPFGADVPPAESPQVFHHEEHPGGIPFFPNYAIKDVAVIALVLAAYLAIVFFAPGLFFPPTAFEPANPFVTPPGIKPEWYFLWAYQALRIFPHELIGIGVQGAFMALLLLLPFIDRNPERRPGRRPIFFACFGLGLVLLVVISVWGHYS